MRQNSVIFGALLIGFIVYVTIKGRLPSYIALFWSKSKQGILPANDPSNPATQSPNLNLALPGMMPHEQYLDWLPQSDKSIGSLARSVTTGYYDSGLPTYPTLRNLWGQAGINVATGAAGL